MSDAKQVVAEGGQEESSVLGDIIEQQREFQRRQELRAGNLAAYCQAMNTSIDSQEEQQVVDRLTEINKGHGTRRKFSLSYAMSNLTSFTSGTLSPASSKAAVSASPAKASKKHFQHRASLVHGQLSSGFGSSFSPVISQRDRDSEKSVSEKKKGFMHKAIRRGSKMFDSMLLSSAQHQAAAAEAEAVAVANSDSANANITATTCAKLTDSSSQEVDEFESELSRVHFGSSTSSSAGVGAGMGMAMAMGMAMGAKVEEAEPATAGELDKEHKRRGRRLRLGSIPHDLRRALSLSNNAHFHRKSSKQHDAEVAANISASLGSQMGLNPALAPNTNPSVAPASASSDAAPSSTTNLATDNNNNNINNNSSSNSSNNSFTSRAAQHLNLTSGKGGQSGAAVNFNRLKRKNSLFSPLTSAGSAFYHHAHFGRHSGEPAAEQNAHQNVGLPGQQQPKASGIGSAIGLGIGGGVRAGNAQAASSTSSQSASFTLCQDHNRTYKLIIFGSSAVGKTSLIQRFLYGLFPGKLWASKKRVVHFSTRRETCYDIWLGKSPARELPFRLPTIRIISGRCE